VRDDVIGRRMSDKTTDFGFQKVPEEDKARRVAGVFSSVASRYDLMNDLMSGGLHRLWKRFAVELTGVREGSRVLDVAGGTGDLTALLAARAGASGEVWLTDVNADMLSRGRDRLLDSGRVVPVARCNAERLPFVADHFDCVIVGFGLRNMTRKEQALAEMLQLSGCGPMFGMGRCARAAGWWCSSSPASGNRLCRSTTPIRSISCLRWADW